MKRYEKYSKEEIIRSFVNPFAKNNREVYEKLMEDIPETKHIYRWELINSSVNLEYFFMEWLSLFDKEDALPISFAQFLRETTDILDDVKIEDRLKVKEKYAKKASRMNALTNQQIIDIFKASDRDCKECVIAKSLWKEAKGINKKDIKDCIDTPYSRVCDDCMSTDKTCTELIEEFLKEEVYFIPRWCTITGNNDLIAMEAKFDARNTKGKESFYDYLMELVEI